MLSVGIAGYLLSLVSRIRGSHMAKRASTNTALRRGRLAFSGRVEDASARRRVQFHHCTTAGLSRCTGDAGCLNYHEKVEKPRQGTMAYCSVACPRRGKRSDAGDAKVSVWCVAHVQDSATHTVVPVQTVQPLHVVVGDNAMSAAVGACLYMRNTPKSVCSVGALRAAARARPRTSRVSCGAMTPSSQRRAEE